MTKLDSLDSLPTNPEQHWAVQYIGRPWVSGAIGPDEFDCWGFFRYIQNLHYGIDVPPHITDAADLKAVATEFRDSAERINWTPASKPFEGCAVLMAHHKYPSHVGLWLDVDGGGVLHCVRGEGVVFSNLSSLKTCGWGRVEYYKYASNT